MARGWFQKRDVGDGEDVNATSHSEEGTAGEQREERYARVSVGILLAALRMEMHLNGSIYARIHPLGFVRHAENGVATFRVMYGIAGWKIGEMKALLL